MSSNDRSEARTVILRLRRYRDRMEEIATVFATVPPADAGVTSTLHRRITSLTTDLDNDAHECVIGRKRMVQTEWEHEFLWPALREASDAMREGRGPTTSDARSKAGLRCAQGRIQHYLTALEGRWPTL
ncbi:MAG: hypothetical protein ACKOSQ_02300 [Planctomycetaceae bacterium]